jgi:hypothetical protein
VILTFVLQPVMVPLFVLTSTSDLMVVPKAPALLPSNLLTMLAMPSNNSTATTGKAAHSRSVKIASLALDPDSAVEVASALVEDLVEVSVLVAVDLVVVDSAVDLEVVVDSEAAAAMVVEQVATMEEPALFLLPPTPLPIMPLLVLREARPSTFAT